MYIIIVGAAVEVVGTVVKSLGKGQQYEIKATAIKLIGIMIILINHFLVDNNDNNDAITYWLYIISLSIHLSIYFIYHLI